MHNKAAGGAADLDPAIAGHGFEVLSVLFEKCGHCCGHIHREAAAWSQLLVRSPLAKEKREPHAPRMRLLRWEPLGLRWTARAEANEVD